MRLSKQTSDAVKILTVCAQADGGSRPVKVAAISEATGITKQLGLKLVNMLARLGYVETIRGPRGGFRLARAAGEISVGSLVRDFEGQRSTPDAGSETGLTPVLDDAFEAFVKVLDGHTIADLAAREPQHTLRAETHCAAPEGKIADGESPAPRQVREVAAVTAKRAGRKKPAPRSQATN